MRLKRRARNVSLMPPAAGGACLLPALVSAEAGRGRTICPRSPSLCVDSRSSVVKGRGRWAAGGRCEAVAGGARQAAGEMGVMEEGFSVAWMMKAMWNGEWELSQTEVDRR
jgi:hypothetical protein